MEEGIERMENWRKCTQCNRPCSGHKGPTGSSCEKEPLNEEQLREYYKKLKRELKGKKTGSKTPRRNQRSISASTAPDVTGNASGKIDKRQYSTRCDWKRLRQQFRPHKSIT